MTGLPSSERLERRGQSASIRRVKAFSRWLKLTSSDRREVGR
jgi:hypothetical protein